MLPKGLLDELRKRQLTEYGTDIPGETIREILGIDYPEFGSKKAFDEVALTELAAVDYCRNVLLGEGKFLASENGGYRILLPSENKRQVDAYMAQADRKLRRAQKLSRNTPVIAGDAVSASSSDVRITMKREGIRYRRESSASVPAEKRA